MESNEVSVHEVRLYLALSSQWVTAKELAKSAQIADRTARAHATKLVKLGIADMAEVFPAHRYRLSDKAGKRNLAYINRLESARGVFGL